MAVCNWQFVSGNWNLNSNDFFFSLSLAFSKSPPNPYQTKPYQTIPNLTKLQIINYKLPITNGQLQIANYQLPITNCQLPITKWPKNISISSQLSYEFDSIELHFCYFISLQSILLNHYRMNFIKKAEKVTFNKVW